MIVIIIVTVVTELLVVPAFVCFYSPSFVTTFILRAINIHTGM